MLGACSPNGPHFRAVWRIWFENSCRCTQAISDSHCLILTWIFESSWKFSKIIARFPMIDIPSSEFLIRKLTTGWLLLVSIDNILIDNKLSLMMHAYLSETLKRLISWSGSVCHEEFKRQLAADGTQFQSNWREKSAKWLSNCMTHRWHSQSVNISPKQLRTSRHGLKCIHQWMTAPKS